MRGLQKQNVGRGTMNLLPVSSSQGTLDLDSARCNMLADRHLIYLEVVSFYPRISRVYFTSAKWDRIDVE